MHALHASVQAPRASADWQPICSITATHPARSGRPLHDGGVGDSVGVLVGCNDVGVSVGVGVGYGVGDADGKTVGADDGEVVGCSVGDCVGRGVGRSVGELEGWIVGLPLGDCDGDPVGANVVGIQPPPMTGLNPVWH